MNILITSAGRRVSLVKAFQKELRAIFPESKVITTDLNPAFSAACHVSDFSLKTLHVSSPKYIEELKKICENHNISVIIPTIDTELDVLAGHKNEFGKTQVLVSDQEFIRICRDKRKTNQFFLDNKVNIPKQYDRKNYQFPVFIKPYNGSLSADIHLIEQENEMLHKFINDDKYMFMEYLSLKIYSEYTIDLYYSKNSELMCAVPRKRIEVRGGEISKGITQKNKIVDFIKDRISEIVGAVGCLTMQLFYNELNHEIYGIEINPRFGGGYPLSYFAGANFPKYIIQEYLLNQEIEYFEDWNENTIMLRYDAEVILNG